MKKPKKAKAARDLRDLVEDCTCSSAKHIDVADRLFWSYTKLAAIAELMEGYRSNGRRVAFGGEKYRDLEFPEKMAGLAEVLIGVAAELALLHRHVDGAPSKPER
jgi:hypothetical protein